MGMSEFRQRVRAAVARMDGVRERRIVAIGSMALLIAMLFGPWMLAAAVAAAKASSLDLQSAARAVAHPVTAHAAVSTAASGSGASPSARTSVTRFAEISSLGAAAVGSNIITASGVQSDFSPASAAFRAESGTAFSRDFPAARGTDGLWRTAFALPPGASYGVRLVIISNDGLQVISPGKQVDIPAAASPLMPPAPAVAPTLAILFPLPDAAQTGVVNFSARISDAAVALIFSVRDGAGGTRNIPAVPADDAGVWYAAFDGEPGDYVLSVRASLADGFVQSFTEHRAFRILAATGTTETTQDAP